MFKILKYIIFLALLLFVLMFLNYQQAINSPADKKGVEVFFRVEKGDGVKKIGANLAEDGLIKSNFFFEIYVWRKKNEKKFQAGTYQLNPNMNTKEIVAILTSGKIIKEERDIKIIEGWTLYDLEEYFEKENLISPQELAALAGLPKIDYRAEKNLKAPKDFFAGFDFLSDKPAYYSLEGYLFPDTYRIFKNAKGEEIIGKILENFGKKLSPALRADIKKQEKSIYQIVTMASVIEKEVRSSDDMKIVSGIFWNRIKIGQPLESCATLAYILGKNKPRYSYDDTRTPSPYNTYINYGLPPGPISNPGLAAIEAAIYPEDSPYNYFLSDPKTGRTIFSKTYEEHLENTSKYLK